MTLRTTALRYAGRIFSSGILLSALGTLISPALLAQNASGASGGSASTPDFSGVYYPLNPFGNLGGRGAAPRPEGQKQGPPPRPTQSAPLSDGSQGRNPNAPSLVPEYLAKWQTISKSRIAGSSEYDYTAKCLPPGMPAMMNMAYGMEVMAG